MRVRSEQIGSPRLRVYRCVGAEGSICADVFIYTCRDAPQQGHSSTHCWDDFSCLTFGTQVYVHVRVCAGVDVRIHARGRTAGDSPRHRRMRNAAIWHAHTRRKKQRGRREEGRKSDGNLKSEATTCGQNIDSDTVTYFAKQRQVHSIL